VPFASSVSISSNIASLLARIQFGVREPAGRSEYRSVAIRCGRNASIQLWVSVVCSSETLPYPAAVMIVLRTFTWNRAAGRSWKVLTQIASNRRS